MYIADVDILQCRLFCFTFCAEIFVALIGSSVVVLVKNL